MNLSYCGVPFTQQHISYILSESDAEKVINYDYTIGYPQQIVM
jgi:hypothetical protein